MKRKKKNYIHTYKLEREKEKNSVEHTYTNKHIHLCTEYIHVYKVLYIR